MQVPSVDITQPELHVEHEVWSEEHSAQRLSQARLLNEVFFSVLDKKLCAKHCFEKMITDNRYKICIYSQMIFNYFISLELYLK